MCEFAPAAWREKHRGVQQQDVAETVIPGAMVLTTFAVGVSRGIARVRTLTRPAGTLSRREREKQSHWVPDRGFAASGMTTTERSWLARNDEDCLTPVRASAQCPVTVLVLLA
jgi:hypothetical protein